MELGSGIKFLIATRVGKWTTNEPKLQQRSDLNATAKDVKWSFSHLSAAYMKLVHLATSQPLGYSGTQTSLWARMRFAYRPFLGPYVMLCSLLLQYGTINKILYKQHNVSIKMGGNLFLERKSASVRGYNGLNVCVPPTFVAKLNPLRTGVNKASEK